MAKRKSANSAGNPAANPAATTRHRSDHDESGDDDSGQDFETALAEVETIVEMLEGGELGLSESLGRYETGIKRLKQCHELLAEAEQRVTVLSGFDAEGNPVSQPIEATNSRSGAGRESGLTAASGLANADELAATEELTATDELTATAKKPAVRRRTATKKTATSQFGSDDALSNGNQDPTSVDDTPELF